MSEVINQQRKIKINLEPFQSFTEKAIKTIAENAQKSVTVAFVSNWKMCKLNRKFRHKNSTTDVLSFLFEADKFDTETETLGDIVINVEQAQKQAIENNLDFETEIKQLLLHGILHLCGYDHETDSGEMNSLELKLRDKLEIS